MKGNFLTGLTRLTGLGRGIQSGGLNERKNFDGIFEEKD
jgi:hypothetical protein